MAEREREREDVPTYTRRQWLTRQAILGGAPLFLAVEAVASVAIEHPEWNMDERKTMADWEIAEHNI